MQRREFVNNILIGGAAAAAGIGLSVAIRADAKPSSLIIDGLSPSALNERYLDMLALANVSAWHKTLSGLATFSATWDFVDKHSDRVVVVNRASDIDRAREEGRLALILGWQTASALGDHSGQELFKGVMNPSGTTGLNAYYQLGLRIVSLTYNTANAFAAGCLEPHLGLTRAGRRLVEEIHDLGILLDVGGHTGNQSSLDALAMSQGVPVICSHTNVAALVDNPRNTSDEVFEGIARSGGVIGVSAVNTFLIRRSQDRDVKVPHVDLSIMLKHINYLKRLVGVNHIGLGPDFTEGRNITINPDHILYGREMAGPEPMSIRYVKGFEDMTQIQNVANVLADDGWSQTEIDKVMGLNWMRVYRQVWS